MWFFFIVSFFHSPTQTVSVTVSILTLTFISIDRWYAIVFPLRYKPQPGRAVIYIAIIWTIGFLFDLPEFLDLHVVKKSLRFDIELFAQCLTSWSAEEEKRFTIIKVIFLYTWVNFFSSVNLKVFNFNDYVLFRLVFLSSSWQSLIVRLWECCGDRIRYRDTII